MSDKSIPVMNVRQAAGELDHAFIRNGWSPEDVKWLSTGNTLDEVLSVRRGTHEIVRIRHTIDLGKAPMPPVHGYEVEKHEGEGVVEIELRSDDNLYIDGKKVVLHLSERQQGGVTIRGYELRKELESGKQVLLNSNVLDYLYEHPQLFPEHWKKDEDGKTRYIYFWGSIFRGPSDGRLSVRCLYWDGGSLDRRYRWLGGGWARRVPAALLAS
jgi:hypothetical protein